MKNFRCIEDLKVFAAATRPIYKELGRRIGDAETKEKAHKWRL